MRAVPLMQMATSSTSSELARQFSSGASSIMSRPASLRVSHSSSCSRRARWMSGRWSAGCRPSNSFLLTSIENRFTDDSRGGHCGNETFYAYQWLTETAKRLNYWSLIALSMVLSANSTLMSSPNTFYLLLKTTVPSNWTESGMRTTIACVYRPIFFALSLS